MKQETYLFPVIGSVSYENSSATIIISPPLPALIFYFQVGERLNYILFICPKQYPYIIGVYVIFIRYLFHNKLFFHKDKQKSRRYTHVLLGLYFYFSKLFTIEAN